MMIKASDNLENADKFFRTLEDIQTEIAIYYFKEEGNISSPLKKFVKDFDRIDEPITQSYLFEKIKKGEYLI